MKRQHLAESLNRLPDYSDDALLAELRRVAQGLGTSQLTIHDIESHARCSYALLKQRFCGLATALDKAGLLAPAFHRDVPEDELLDELERIWEETLARDGRRPFKRDLRRYNARFSQGPYYRRWGSWIRACEAVLERSQVPGEVTAGRADTASAEAGPRRTVAQQKRRISLGLRYRVLRRDRFRCTVCGCSPATHPGTLLHVDHVLAESKGGRTHEDNLRTLCEDCNLGKGAS